MPHWLRWKGGRASRHWLNLAVSVLLLLAILVVVQVVAERHNVRFDLTPSRRLSLSQVTRQVLAGVEDDLEIEAYHPRWGRAEVEDLLGRFAAASAHIHYRLFDIDRYPERARAAGIHYAGRARVAYRGVHTVVSTASEEYLAGAIIRVLRGKSRHVYFLHGHGERRLGPAGGQGVYWIVAGALKRENSATHALDLGAVPSVPADADAVVIAGPKRDVLPEEIERLEAYLDNGGAILLLLDPGPLPRLKNFLARVEVRLGDDIIVDRSNRILGAEALVVKVPYYRMHPVTAPTDVPAVFVGARTVDTPTPGGAVQVVARSVESGWSTAEIEAARRGEVTYRKGRDQPGPLPVMVAASLQLTSEGGRSGRLVVIGDSDFAADDYVDLLGNRDLFLNSISWLTDEEALIARRPREIAEIARPLSPLVLTERQTHVLFLIAVVVQPALLILLGSAVVAVRRRRG